MAGVHLNVGHGNNGWGMACGSARLVSDLIAQKTTALDAAPFNPMRFHA
jgi:D-amino-acid dehydrogenase